MRLNNRTMLEQVGLALAMDSIGYNIYPVENRQKDEPRTYFELSVSSAFDLNRLIHLYAGTSIKVDRLTPRVLDGSGRRRPRGCGFFIGDVQLATVRSVETLPYDDDVFDFEVADNHTFLVNGRFFGNNCKLHEVNKALASIRGEFDRPEDVEFV